MNPIITETDSRVVATDANGVEICGAYRPAGHDYWQLYVSRSVTELTGRRVPPHREHFWGEHGKADARAWVEIIAALYCLAVSVQDRAA